MLKWKDWTERVKQPEARRDVWVGPINLCIDHHRNEHGTRWAGFYLAFRRQVDMDFAELVETWPRRAIAEARAQLDKLEAELGEQCEAHDTGTGE